MTLRPLYACLMSLLILPFVGCAGNLQTISVTPAAGTETLTAAGQTAQFRAVGTYQMGSATPTTKDITSEVKWTTASSGVATINASGLATATGSGTTVVSAELDGQVATSSLTVTATSGAGTATPTLTIIPQGAAATATRVDETTQFLAFGDLNGTGIIQDLTDQVQWISSDVSVATIDQAGLATGVAAILSANTTTITAIAKTATGSVLTATSTLTVTAPQGPDLLATLSIFEVGTGNGTVTGWATDDPGTIVINCPPATTSCTGNFPIGTSVTLMATPGNGSVFGGWSADCVPTAPNLPNEPPTPTCTIVLSGTTAKTPSDTVGAIFNTPQ